MPGVPDIVPQDLMLPIHDGHSGGMSIPMPFVLDGMSTLPFFFFYWNHANSYLTFLKALNPTVWLKSQRGFQNRISEQY